MKADARRIRSALSAPPTDIRFYLLHGPDEAGARSLAALLAKTLGESAERVDIDGAALRGDPSRLADEAAALSLFGGARYIRVAGMGEESFAAIQLLLDAPHGGNPVIGIAPTVRTTAKIVKLAIASPRALAHGCYMPEGEAAERLVAELARDAGLRLAPGIAAAVVACAAGDRSIMHAEVEKLALYLDAGHDRPRDVDQDALAAVGADLGDSEAARVAAAMLAGELAVLGNELERLAAAQLSPVAWLRHIGRQLLSLAEMRVLVDRGEPIDAVLKGQRVHFSQEAATRRILGTWTSSKLAKAIALVRDAERKIMATQNAGDVIAHAAVLDLGRSINPR